MASRMHAVNAYRPRIILGPTAQRRELARYIADRTSLNEGEVGNVLLELRDAIIHFAARGAGSKLDGIGTFLPSIKLDGSVKLSFRVDRSIKNALNNDEIFNGTIQNRDNIGLTMEELVDRWNQANPDDPIEL